MYAFMKGLSRLSRLIILANSSLIVIGGDSSSRCWYDHFQYFAVDMAIVLRRLYETSCISKHTLCLALNFNLKKYISLRGISRSRLFLLLKHYKGSPYILLYFFAFIFDLGLRFLSKFNGQCLSN